MIEREGHVITPDKPAVQPRAQRARAKRHADRGVLNRTADPAYSGERGLSAALAQLPGRLRQGIRLFRNLTGLTAVTSIRGAAEGQYDPDMIVPPVHPRCASLLRTIKQDAPCAEEWRTHVRKGLRDRSIQSHICSLGLRCSCVPIFYGGTLVGIAKFVADPQMTRRQVLLAVRALELAVSQVCQDSYVSSLSDELIGLQRQVAELQQVRGGAGSDAGERDPSDDARARSEPTVHARSRVEDVLEYLRGHYLDSDLSLAAVSRAFGLSDKYLTQLFTRVVGQRMHAYIVHLRIQHSCRELVNTRTPIKRIAYESGFKQPDRFRRAFHHEVGVAPSTYRRIFTNC